MFKTKSQECVANGLRSKSDPTNVIAVDAMRPEFLLGSLYDRRTDNLLPSHALWKEDSLSKKGFYSEKISSSQQWLIDSENTFSSKVKKLDIEGGLTLSLLGELVDIKGHAKYLQDTVLSRNMAKVSLTFKETTVYRELISDALNQIDFQDLLTKEEKNVAFTHVVIAIQYGGISTMVFERNVKETESKGKIEEALSLALKAIATSKDGNLNLSSNKKEYLDNIKCTVYSDFVSNTKIVNLDDASALYKPFPTILSASGNYGIDRAVPVKVWLLPKNLLAFQPHTVMKEISSSFSNKSKEIIESLTRAKNESHDLLNEMKNYSILKEKITHFLKATENYKSAFHKSVLRPSILSVRNNSEEKSLLPYSFRKHRRSPFHYLAPWLEKLKEEVGTLLIIENQLSNAGVFFVNEDFLQNNVKRTTSVVLTIKVSRRKDEFIKKMENYNLSQSETLPGVKDLLNEKLWFEDDSLKEKILGMVYKMRNIALANQNNEDVSFFVREIECEKISECHIEAWANGIRLGLKSFEILTELQNLRVERYSHDTLEIKWKVRQGAKSSISTYKIEVSCLSDGDQRQRLESLSQARISPTSDDVITHEVVDLQPGSTYKISLQCLCLNHNIFGEPAEVFQMTRLSNPPVNFKAEVLQKRLVKLSWGDPTIPAKDANCKGFVIEYKTTTENNWKNRLVQAHLHACIFCDLNYTTEYKFRILARYEKEEETLPTEEIHLKTESMEVIQIEKVCINLGTYTHILDICQYLFLFRSASVV